MSECGMFENRTKKGMDSFDIMCVVLELKKMVTGAAIDNVYQTDERTIILRLRHPKQDLIIEAGKRIHLTKYLIEKPSYPSQFCRSLRKYLRGGVLREIRQKEFERIVTIEVSGREEVFNLVCEIFGKGNIILVDQKNKILQALTYRRMRDRNVVRGTVFEHPPRSGLNPLKITLRQLEPIRDYKVKSVIALTKLLSISGLYAEEVLKKAGVNKNLNSNFLTDQQIEKIYCSIKDLTSNLRVGAISPQTILDEGNNWVSVLPFPISVYEKFSSKHYTTFNEATDEYFTNKATKAVWKQAVARVENQKRKQERILKQQEKRLKTLKEALEKNQLIGDLTYLHLNELQALRQTILKQKESGIGWEKIISDFREGKRRMLFPARFVELIEPKKGIVGVNVDGHRFNLKIKQTIQQNATSFYEKAKKAKRKLVGVESSIAKTKEKLEKLRKKRFETVEEAYKPSTKRKRRWYEKFHWFSSSDGFLVIGGRDASTNELLIKRHMEPNDIVLHADIQGAPFVIIKSEKKIPINKTIFDAAQLSASYSKAWKLNLSSVDVFWVNPEQVSKRAPSGEYLQKGSFMISGPKNYLKNVPLQISIGIKEQDSQLIVIGGPTSAVASKTKLYVEVIPGKRASGELAREIKIRLISKAPRLLREQIRKIQISEIQRFIPAGKGEIKETK